MGREEVPIVQAPPRRLLATREKNLLGKLSGRYPIKYVIEGTPQDREKYAIEVLRAGFKKGKDGANKNVNEVMYGKVEAETIYGKNKFNLFNISTYFTSTVKQKLKKEGRFKAIDKKTDTQTRQHGD